jgi:hypothetical protein
VEELIRLQLSIFGDNRQTQPNKDPPLLTRRLDPHWSIQHPNVCYAGSLFDYPSQIYHPCPHVPNPLSSLTAKSNPEAISTILGKIYPLPKFLSFVDNKIIEISALFILQPHLMSLKVYV